jgi:PAS domain S-box-containing protein
MTPEQTVRILLIEDDPDYATLMNVYVNEACGASLRYALRGVERLEDGLRLLEREEFDIALLDLILPDSRGVETLDRLRRTAPGLPVVVLTNLDQEEIGLEAIAAGAQDFLPKNKVDSGRLRHAIGFALARDRLHRQMQALIDSSPDGMLVVDRSRVVRYANASAVALFGRPRDEIVGRPTTLVLNPERPRETALERAGAEPVTVEVRVAEIEWKDGPAWLAAMRDVSQIKKLEHARAEIRERRRMDQLKDQLLSTVSHELRTPLSVVKAIVGNMRDGLAGALTDDQKEMVGTADRHIDRLTRLLNNFLDLSRLESRRARINLRELDPLELIQDVAEGVQMVHRNRAVEIRLELPPVLPAVRADPDMITQVLSNLFDNAMRYARSRVVLRAAAADGGVEISVTDDGPGLPAEGLEGLFNKFVQLDRPRGGPGYKGTGLGLAITREILSLHGGEIHAENAPGSGARFRFSLPAAARAPAGREGRDAGSGA